MICKTFNFGLTAIYHSFRRHYKVSDIRYIVDKIPLIRLCRDYDEANWTPAGAIRAKDGIRMLDNDLVEKANTAANSLCIKEPTSKFISEIRKELDRKEALVGVFFRNLDLPFDAGCLEYLDCIHNNSREKSLKEVLYSLSDSSL